MNTNRRKRILPGGWLRLLNVILVIALILGPLPLPSVQAAPSGAADATSHRSSGQLSPQAQAPTSLVTNGDFSAGDTGWTYTGGITGCFQDGTLYFSCGGQSADGVIWQDINTVAGRSYTLDYDVFRLGPGGGTPQALVEVIDAGTSAVIASTVSAGNDTEMALVHTTLTFVAQGPVIVRFTDQTTDTNSLDLGLDNVTVLAPAGCVPQPANLVGWWRAQGNANDFIGGNNGTLQNGATFGAGQVGQAFSLDGTGQYVSIPSNANIEMRNNLTVMAWFKINSLASGANAKVFSKRLDHGPYEINLNNDGANITAQSMLSIDNAYWISGPQSQALSTGTWYQVALVVDGSNLHSLYLNGQLLGTVQLPDQLMDHTGAPLLFGIENSGFFPLDGSVDEVQIFNRALSAAEITRIYNADGSGVCPGPNTAPVAANDSYSTNQNTTLNQAAPGVLANDTDVDGNPLEAIKVTDPAHGTVTLNADGSFVYTPTVGYSGPDSFTYKANDGALDSNVATVNITVIKPVSPDLTEDHASVTTPEGQTATNSGTFWIVNGHPLTLTTSVGTLGLTNPSSLNVAGFWKLGEDDPGATAGGPGTNPTLGRNGNGLNPALNLTRHGSPVYTSTIDPASGSTLAMTFNGLNASYVLGSPVVTATDNFGLDVWLMPTANLTTTQRVIINGAVPGNGFGIDLVNMVITGVYNRNAYRPFSSGITTTVGSWYHVILVRDTGVTRLYVNDSLVYENSGLAAPLPATNFGIGSGAGFTVFFTGAVDEARVFTFTPGTWTWSHTPDDGPVQSQSVTITATDTISGEVTTLSFPLTVVNVAPTATFANGGAVNEGSTGTVSFSGQSDPSTADTTAGFHYAYDFNNDGTFEVGDGTYAGSSTTVSATVPASYLAQGPGTRTVLGRILDKDGGFTDYTTTITINNVAPVAQDQSVTTNQDTPVTITLAATDAGNDPLTYSIVTPPAHGTLSGTGANHIYTPTAGYSGGDSFTFTANDGLADSNIATVSITVTAVNHTMTFNSNGGMGTMAPETHNVPTALTTNTFTRTGYTFAGWNTLANGTGTAYADGAIYSFAADVTLYAQWAALPNHTVTFNSNGGTGTMTAQTANVPTALTTNTFTRTGYTFAGWNTQAGGGGTSYTDGAIYSFAADVTLYAQWTALPNHTVTFDNNGGTGTMAPETHNVPTVLTTNTFTRTGYTFAGWNTLANGTGTAYADGAIYSFAADVTLYAQWTALPNHTVTFDNNGGTGTMTAQVANVPTALTTNTFTRTGYTFAGWNTATNGTGTAYADGATYSFAADVTLYAQWTALPNHTPVAVNDTYTTTQGTPLIIAAPGVLTNDTDADGDPLTAIKVSNSVHGGIVLLNPNGALVYAPPAPDFTGVDSFTYKANDGAAGAGADSNVATVTIVVGNHAPVAVNDAYSTHENTPLTVALSAGVLINDTDADGDSLTAIKVSDPMHGVVTLNADGSFTYTPTAGYSGADSFTYKANDGAANSNTATVSLTVNAAPVAVNDAYSVHQNAPRTVAAPGVLTNDTDAEGDPLTAVKVSDPAHGAVTLNADGSFTYTPTVGYSGADSFTYKANDGATDSNTATVSLTVTAVNVAPVAMNDAYTTTQGTPLIIAAPGVLINDTDADGDPLTAIKVSNSAYGGIVLLNSNGALVYAPPTPDFTGVDSFTYKVNDGAAGAGADSNVATVTIAVGNHAPVAVNDAYSAHENTPLTVTPSAGVLTNDTDADGDPLIAVKVSDPAHGALTLNADGSFVYTPTAHYHGADSFTYRANDGAANINTATVNLTVHAANVAPVATNDTYSVHQDTPRTVAAPGVLTNDTDAEGDPLTAIKVSDPAHGMVTLNADGSFTYTPTVGYTGADSFTYQANDGAADSNVATVTITVTTVNVAPVAANDAYTTTRGTPLTVVAPGVLTNDTDADGDPLTAIKVSNPAHGGILVLNSNGALVYAPPTPDFTGEDYFT